MNCQVCLKGKMREATDDRGRVWVKCSHCPNKYIIKYLEPVPHYGDKVATEL